MPSTLTEEQVKRILHQELSKVFGQFGGYLEDAYEAMRPMYHDAYLLHAASGAAQRLANYLGRS